METAEIKYGACYSNGVYGKHWAVYRITRWAKYEVVLKENEWVRVEERSRVTANSNTA